MTFFEKLESLLMSGGLFKDATGAFLKEKAIAEANKYSPELLRLLLSDAEMKAEFFVQAEGSYIFKLESFMNTLKNKAFLPDSYTAFQNKIGFNIAPALANKVVLDFPYKDCYLEGGQTAEDSKRQEVFFNKLLAKDQIQKLLEPKVLVNALRVSAKGETPLGGWTEDEQGSLRDNLLIKGNNLLALHSLKKRFAGKVKLIYIDPPYNTGTNQDTFLYNNTFKRSSWLVFMKNRLEVAKELLRTDGCLIVAIDDNEQCYLGVLLKELFSEDFYEHHCITIVHNPRGVIGTNFSATHEYAFFVLPKGKKVITDKKIEDSDIEWSPLRNWGDESLRTDAKNCFYPIIVKDNEIIGFGDVPDTNFHPKSQNMAQKDGSIHIYPIDQGGIERKWRYARQSVDAIAYLLRVKVKKDSIDIELGKNFSVHKTVWIDKRYDANTYGTQLIKALVPNCPFKFPKSLWNVYDCISSVCQNDKDALILDFFGGSGTTAHAVLELNKQDGGNRKFILVEQMDYVESVTKERIKAVLKTENLDDSFVYTELAAHNQNYIDALGRAKTKDEVLEVYGQIQKNAYVHYLFDFADLNRSIADGSFGGLSLRDQKHFLCEILEMNMLYIPLSSLEDEDHRMSAKDIALNRGFYRHAYGEE